MKKRTKVKKQAKKTAKTAKVARTVAKAKPRKVHRHRSPTGESVLSKPQIVQAAVRFYEKDHRQRDIAKSHKISSSYLARLLIKSRAAGVFSVKVVGNAVKVAPVKKPVKRRARRPAKKSAKK